MIRKILLYVFVLTLLTGVVWLYMEMHNAGKEVDSPLKAISQDVLLVYETHNPLEIRKNISHNSVIWEDFKSIEAVEELDKYLHALDTTISDQPEWSEMLQKTPSYFALEPIEDGHAFLWVVRHGANVNSSELWEEALDIFNGKSAGENQMAFSQNGEKYFLHFTDDLILLSTDSELILSALQRCLSDDNLYADSNFLGLYDTKGKVEHGHVFLNNDGLGRFLKSGLKEVYQNAAEQSIADLGHWSVLDVSVKSNSWMLNGFTRSEEDDFLSLFRNRYPHDHDAVEVMPENTAGFIHFGFSNFPGWYGDYKKYLGRHNKLFAHDSLRQHFIDNQGVDFEKSIISWVESEVVSGYRNDPLLNHDERYFAILKTANEKLAADRLLEISVNDTFDFYSQYPINRLAYPELLSGFPGDLFAELNQPHYAIIDRYILFSESERSVKHMINDYLAGRTLSKSENFQKFDQSVSGESNIFVFYQPALNNGLIQKFTEKRFSSFLSQHDSLMLKFGGVGIQWSYERENLFYQTLNLLHNPVSKEQPHSLWELALDTMAVTRPFTVKNHNTGALEIFVQDAAKTCYLISNTGKVLWKKKIPELIMSEVHQIDRYENNKLQLLFNTSNKLYLIDRLGNNVENYPVSFPAEATADMSLFDYDNNSDLRIIIPVKGGKLLNFDKEGEEVKGWKFKEANADIVAPVMHTRIKRKDYIITINENGKVRGFSRRGIERLNFEETLPLHERSRFFLDANKTLEESFIVTADSLGIINKLYLNGTLQRKEVGRFQGRNLFVSTDINMNGVADYVIADSTGIRAFDNDKKELFRYEYTRSTPQNIRVFKPNNTVTVGVNFKNDNQILMVNRTGKVWPDFPLRGATSFSVVDINDDGELNLQVTGNSGILYNYVLNEAH